MLWLVYWAGHVHFFPALKRSAEILEEGLFEGGNLRLDEVDKVAVRGRRSGSDWFI